MHNQRRPANYRKINESYRPSADVVFPPPEALQKKTEIELLPSDAVPGSIGLLVAQSQIKGEYHV